MYRYAVTGYAVSITFSQLAPVQPVAIRDMEGPADITLTAKLEVTLGGSLTETCEAWFRHSFTCWTPVSNR
jgi:hypothetical protein